MSAVWAWLVDVAGLSGLAGDVRLLPQSHCSALRAMEE